MYVCMYVFVFRARGRARAEIIIIIIIVIVIIIIIIIKTLLKFHNNYLQRLKRLKTRVGYN